MQRARRGSKTCFSSDDEIVQSLIFRVAIRRGPRFQNDNLAYHAFCPALKGCHTWGHSPEETLANIREAVELYVEDLTNAGDPIPGARVWC